VPLDVVAITRAAAFIRAPVWPWKTPEKRADARTTIQYWE
jgi:hypothetical protein